MYITNSKTQYSSQTPVDSSSRQAREANRQINHQTNRRTSGVAKTERDEDQKRTKPRSGELVKATPFQVQAYAQESEAALKTGLKTANRSALDYATGQSSLLENGQSAIRGQLVEDELPSNRAQRAIMAYTTHQNLEQRSHITQFMGIDDYA